VSKTKKKKEIDVLIGRAREGRQKLANGVLGKQAMGISQRPRTAVQIKSEKTEIKPRRAIGTVGSVEPPAAFDIQRFFDRHVNGVDSPIERQPPRLTNVWTHENPSREGQVSEKATELRARTSSKLMSR